MRVGLPIGRAKILISDQIILKNFFITQRYNLNDNLNIKHSASMDD